jgi:hypothetical protein
MRLWLRLKATLLLIFLFMFFLFALTAEDSRRPLLAVGLNANPPMVDGLISHSKPTVEPLSTLTEESYFNSTWGGSSYDYGRSVVADSSGNIYITGDTQSFGAGGRDAFILKLSPAGGLVWQRTWGGIGNDEGRGVVIDPSGQIYVTGFTNSSGAGNYDVFALKLNSTDADVYLEWQRTIGGVGDDEVFGVAFDTFGNPVVAGYVSEAPPYNINSSNFILGTPTFNPVTSSFPLNSPTADLGIPSGTVSTPLGSTAYGGNTDAIFFIIPEFQSSLIIPLFMMATLLTVAICKRKTP